MYDEDSCKRLEALRKYFSTLQGLDQNRIDLVNVLKPGKVLINKLAKHN